MSHSVTGNFLKYFVPFIFIWLLIIFQVTVTQVHDELVLEVDPSVIKEAALLLKTSMENAVSLLGSYSVLFFHFAFFFLWFG